jgi:spermidine synthase
MGGLCLGSLVLPCIVRPSVQHPLRAYALIELGVGICGIAVWAVVPHLGHFYAVNAVSGFQGILWRGFVCALCLLPATLLMGASLPAAARWVESGSQGVRWLGFFYGANVAGAVCGCLFAGFYLLRVHDVTVATLFAALLNFAVAVGGLRIASLTKYLSPARETAPEGSEGGPGFWPIYTVIALSGFGALGAEAVWTRLLSLIIGPSVYTFSIILSVFLAGMAVGSGGASLALARLRLPRVALGWCQMLLAGAVAYATYMISVFLPYWHMAAWDYADPWATFRFDLVRCLCAILPAAVLWGASFPLALASLARNGQDPGRLAGRVYAANTFGAILGAITFSILLIPGIGTQNSGRLLVGLAVAAGLIALASLFHTLRASIELCVSVAAAIVLAWIMPPLPWEVVAWGHHQLPRDVFRADLLYMGEGMNASVAITQKNLIRSFHVNGKVEASAEPQDMRLQRMLGHIPAMLHPNLHSVLVVGFGAGVTAGTFVVHPGVNKIVICEIEPLVPPAASEFFRQENHDVRRDPRTRIVQDDARHYILTTPEKFDIITSDPIHPWVRGSAPLYTKEYFELCKRHLNSGGIITQWVPLYQSTMETVKSELATFFEVFPNGTIWSAEAGNRENDDVVLLGQSDPTRIDVEVLQRTLEQGESSLVAESLRQIGFPFALDLLRTYAGRGSDLRPWLAGAEINRDRNLRLQYLAGMGLNRQDAESIYSEMLLYRGFPEDLFTGPERMRQSLRDSFRRP